MHAFLLALLAAKQRVIATFDGYAGSTGKKASAALPIEILRRVSVKIGPDFAVSYHSLADYQAPRGSDDLKAERPIAQTYDKHAHDVFNELKNEEIVACIEPRTGGKISDIPAAGFTYKAGRRPADRGICHDAPSAADVQSG